MLEQFQSQVKGLADSSQARVSAERQLQVALANRDSAVEKLKTDLTTAAQFAAAIGSDGFKMPRSLTVPTLVEAGNSLLEEIPSIQADLAQHGFPANFAAVLGTKVDALKQTQREYLQAKRNRSGRAHAWDELLAETLHTVYRLDVVATLALQNNPAAMAEYTMARTVRKTSTSREEVTSNLQGATASAEATPAPITKTAAA